jgi:hypothetical protein
MRARMLALQMRRGALATRAAQEREALERWLERADAAARWFGACRDLARALLGRPAWVAGALALALALRPRRTLRLLARAWSLYRLARTAVSWWRKRVAPLLGRSGP